MWQYIETETPKHRSINLPSPCSVPFSKLPLLLPRSKSSAFYYLNRSYIPHKINHRILSILISKCVQNSVILSSFLPPSVCCIQYHSSPGCGQWTPNWYFFLVKLIHWSADVVPCTLCLILHFTVSFSTTSPEAMGDQDFCF